MNGALSSRHLNVPGWSELNVLRYVQSVRGERKDLTLQQNTPSTLPERMEMWGRSHDLATHPFVFTELPENLPNVPRDTIALGDGRFIYVQRVRVGE